MSQAYNFCVANGGKVTTMTTPEGAPVKACVIHGKRFMGQVTKPPVKKIKIKKK